jgi:hypothetical protein
MNQAGFLSSAGVVWSLHLKRSYEPLRLPAQASVLSLPYTRRSAVSPPPRLDLQHWATTLQEHADPATPGVNGRYFRCSGVHPTAFPFCPQGRLLHFVDEATHGFTGVTACSLAVWKLTTPHHCDAASLYYRGVRTTPRTGLQPARLAAVTAYGQTTFVLC